MYSYPVLGLTLLLGAIGLPVPTGLATAVAGSLAARGSLSWAWAAALGVIASVLGDAVGYGLGRVLGRRFLVSEGTQYLSLVIPVGRYAPPSAVTETLRSALEVPA